MSLTNDVWPTVLQLNGLLEQQEKDRRNQRAKVASGADLIAALRQQKRELESKCASASERLRKTKDETAFLRVSCAKSPVFDSMQRCAILLVIDQDMRVLHTVGFIA